MQHGEILISSLQHFRDLEKSQGPGIGDRLEGASELRAPENMILTENSTELMNTNRALSNFFSGTFAKIEGGGTIVISGSTFIQTLPPLYIYSFSGGDIDDLRIAAIDKISRSYDGCLRILSPANLTIEMIEKGVELSTNEPAKNLFLEAGIDAVKYEDVITTISEAAPPAASPFVKRKIFSDQKEHRTVFCPVDRPLPERLTIKIDQPQRFFEIVH
jgi:hypothetical protein